MICNCKISTDKRVTIPSVIAELLVLVVEIIVLSMFDSLHALLDNGSTYT